jgi:fatty-acyl-CoA synthase
MAALVLPDGVGFDPETFREFLTQQGDLGPKQWPSFVRVSSALPRTATGKIQKFQLRRKASSVEALE